MWEIRSRLYGILLERGSGRQTWLPVYLQKFTKNPRGNVRIEIIHLVHIVTFSTCMILILLLVQFVLGDFSFKFAPCIYSLNTNKCQNMYSNLAKATMPVHILVNFVICILKIFITGRETSLIRSWQWWSLTRIIWKNWWRAERYSLRTKRKRRRRFFIACCQGSLMRIYNI